MLRVLRRLDTECVQDLPYEYLGQEEPSNEKGDFMSEQETGLGQPHTSDDSDEGARTFKLSDHSSPASTDDTANTDSTADTDFITGTDAAVSADSTSHADQPISDIEPSQHAVQDSTVADSSIETSPTPSNVEASHEDSSREHVNEGARSQISQTAVLWICWAIMVAFNAYSELGRLAGTTTGEVSNREFAWFTPAGYVFAIWGVIYVALAVFLAVLPREHLPELWNTGFNAVGIVFILSCALNISWLIVWHYAQFTASMIIIIATAVCVWLMYLLLRRTGAGILAWGPIAIYASWLAVATCANASYLAVHEYPHIDTTVQATTTFFLLILLLGGAFALRTRGNDWISPLVVIWAAIGIGVRLFDTSAPIGVIIIAMTAIGALLIYFPWQHYSIVANSKAEQ